jgi:hypothetical protein
MHGPWEARSSWGFVRLGCHTRMCLTEGRRYPDLVSRARPLRVTPRGPLVRAGLTGGTRAVRVSRAGERYASAPRIRFNESGPARPGERSPPGRPEGGAARDEARHPTDGARPGQGTRKRGPEARGPEGRRSGGAQEGPRPRLPTACPGMRVPRAGRPRQGPRPGAREPRERARSPGQGRPGQAGPPGRAI